MVFIGNKTVIFDLKKKRREAIKKRDTDDDDDDRIEGS